MLIKKDIQTPDVEGSSWNMMIHFKGENFLDINIIASCICFQTVSVFKHKCLRRADLMQHSREQDCLISKTRGKQLCHCGVMLRLSGGPAEDRAYQFKKIGNIIGNALLLTFCNC